MDGISFDRLVRRITEDASRRGLLRSAFAATVTGIGAASLLGGEEAEAKSCKQKCKQKNSKDARKKCKKKCQKQDQNDPGQKQPGALCDDTGECAPPFTCALPLNDSGGDKRCCGETGAPCGGDNIDFDDLPPICCQGFICSTDGDGNSQPGVCQLAP